VRDKKNKKMNKEIEKLEKEQKWLIELKTSTLKNSFIDEFDKHLKVVGIQHKIDINEIKLTRYKTGTFKKDVGININNIADSILLHQTEIISDPIRRVVVPIHEIKEALKKFGWDESLPF
jgi:hypothetical protein